MSNNDALNLLREWPARKASISSEFNEYTVRDKVIRVENYRESLSHQKIPKIAVPTMRDWGDQLKFLLKENLPGAYPYTAASIRIAAPAKTRPACSPAKAHPSAPTGASIT
jgi:hypothetical protein